jgi:type II secretory pathway component GspD/PulD (secretin)
LRQFIKLLDVPIKKFEKRDVPLKYAKASDIQARLLMLIASRQGKLTKTIPNKVPIAGGGSSIKYTVIATPQEIAPFIDVNERTNALVMIGVPADLDDLTELVALYDVPKVNLQEVKFYPLLYQAADDVVTAIITLNLLGPDLNTGGAGKRTGSGAPRAGGGPTMPSPAPSGGSGGTMLYGTGATPKLTVMESQNTLILMAMPDEQKIVADFVKQVDVIPSEFGAIRVYPLERRNSDDVANMLKSVFNAGSVDPRTRAALPGVEGAPTVVSLTDINAVIASASPQQQEDIARLILQIDASQPQVLLEATLVEVTNNNGFNLGIELEHLQANNNYAGTQLGLTQVTPPHLSLTGGQATSVTASGTVGTSATSLLGGSLAFLSDGQVVALLQALESKTKGRTLSKPRMLVNNNFKNAILSSQDKQATTSLDALTSNVSTVSFKGYQGAGTTLTITPMISDGNFIKLDITLDVSAFTGPGSADGTIPGPMSDRSIFSEITCPDQRTVVIGGLVGRNVTEGTNQVPFFGDIPIIGELFKSHVNSDATTTLYLFVKASILRDVTFEDMFSETRDTRAVLPKDIKKLDPTLSDASAAREADKLNAVIKKRAAEKKAAAEVEAAAEAKTRARGIGRSEIPVVPAPVTPQSAAPEQAPVVPPAAPGSGTP